MDSDTVAIAAVLVFFPGSISMGSGGACESGPSSWESSEQFSQSLPGLPADVKREPGHRSLPGTSGLPGNSRLPKSGLPGTSGVQRALFGEKRARGGATSNKILLCEFCDASFTSAAGLYLHKTSVHFHRAFKCHICGRMLKRKENLSNHLKAVHAQHADVQHAHAQLEQQNTVTPPQGSQPDQS